MIDFLGFETMWFNREACIVVMGIIIRILSRKFCSHIDDETKLETVVHGESG